MSGRKIAIIGTIIMLFLIMPGVVYYYASSPFSQKTLTPAQTIASFDSTIETIQETSSQIIDVYSSQISHKVTKVIDGDSIVLSSGEEIRLLGINAPEKGYPLYSEAKNKLSTLVLGKEVWFESDSIDKDQHDRFLRYVFEGETFVNVQMVKEGWANIYTDENLKYSVQLKDAELSAQTNNLGIWKKKNTYGQSVYLVTLHYNAAGEDDKNLNDEYIVLGNKGAAPVDMTGWTVKDEANNIYTFPTFILSAREFVTIYSGSGFNTGASLYWGKSDSAVWNNNGDTLFLRNAEGDLILTYNYT